jgi:hypothetical protein
MSKVIPIKKSPGRNYFGEIIVSTPEAAVVVGAILAVGLAQFIFVLYGTFASLVASVGCTAIGVAWGLWLRRRRRTEDWTPPLINAGRAAPSSSRDDVPLRDAA